MGRNDHDWQMLAFLGPCSGCLACLVRTSVAQDAAKTQDEALDSLLEKLEKPGQERKESKEPATTKARHHPEAKTRGSGRQARPGTDAKPDAKANPKPRMDGPLRQRMARNPVRVTFPPRTRTSTRCWKSWARPRMSRHPKSAAHIPNRASRRPLKAGSGRRRRPAKRKPSRRTRVCKAKTRRSTRSSRNSPARNARRRAASRKREAVLWARSSRRCGTSSSGLASPRPVKILSPSRSESSRTSTRSFSR